MHILSKDVIEQVKNLQLAKNKRVKLDIPSRDYTAVELRDYLRQDDISILDFSVEGGPLNDNDAKVIARAMPGSPVRVLNLAGNHIGPCTQRIFAELITSTNIHALNLRPCAKSTVDI